MTNDNMSVDDATRVLEEMRNGITNEANYWRSRQETRRKIKPSEYAMTVSSLERKIQALDMVMEILRHVNRAPEAVR